jgi:hypothetical protein
LRRPPSSSYLQDEQQGELDRQIKALRLKRLATQRNMVFIVDLCL